MILLIHFITYRQTVNSTMCRNKFYQSSFFPSQQPFGTPSLMNDFHQINDLTALKGRANKFLLLKWPVTPYVQWLEPCKGLFVYIKKIKLNH